MTTTILHTVVYMVAVWRKLLYVWAFWLLSLGRHLAYDACFKLCCFKRSGQQPDAQSLNQEHFYDDAEIDAVSNHPAFRKDGRHKDNSCGHEFKADESGERNNYRQV